MKKGGDTRNDSQVECRDPSQYTEKSSSRQKEQRTRRRQNPMPEIQQQPPPLEAQKQSFKWKLGRPSCSPNKSKYEILNTNLERVVRELPSMLPHFLVLMPAEFREKIEGNQKKNERWGARKLKMKTWVYLCFFNVSFISSFHFPSFSGKHENGWFTEEPTTQSLHLALLRGCLVREKGIVGG